MAKKSDTLKVQYLAFPKFSVCLLNKFDEKNEKKHANEKQGKQITKKVQRTT